MILYNFAMSRHEPWVRLAQVMKITSAQTMFLKPEPRWGDLSQCGLGLGLGVIFKC